MDTGTLGTITSGTIDTGAKTVRWLPHRLIITDLDGCLVPFVPTYDSTALVVDMVTALRSEVALGAKVAIATNQGGVGCRLVAQRQGWRDWQRFPTEDEAGARLDRVVENLQAALDTDVYLAYCFWWVSSKGETPTVPPLFANSKAWSRFYRKPNAGMLFDCMTWAGVSPGNTLMIGDLDTDEEAAFNARCRFVRPHEFLMESEDEIPF